MDVGRCFCSQSAQSGRSGIASRVLHFWVPRCIIRIRGSSDHISQRRDDATTRHTPAFRVPHSATRIPRPAFHTPQPAVFAGSSWRRRRSAEGQRTGDERPHWQRRIQPHTSPFPPASCCIEKLRFISISECTRRTFPRHGGLVVVAEAVAYCAVHIAGHILLRTGLAMGLTTTAQAVAGDGGDGEVSEAFPAVALLSTPCTSSGKCQVVPRHSCVRCGWWRLPSSPGESFLPSWGGVSLAQFHPGTTHPIGCSLSGRLEEQAGGGGCRQGWLGCGGTGRRWMEWERT